MSFWQTLIELKKGQSDEKNRPSNVHQCCACAKHWCTLFTSAHIHLVKMIVDDLRVRLAEVPFFEEVRFNAGSVTSSNLLVCRFSVLNPSERWKRRNSFSRRFFLSFFLLVSSLISGKIEWIAELIEMGLQHMMPFLLRVKDDDDEREEKEEEESVDLVIDPEETFDYPWSERRPIYLSHAS